MGSSRLNNLKNSLLARKAMHFISFTCSSSQENLSKLTWGGMESVLPCPPRPGIFWCMVSSPHPVLLVLPTYHLWVSSSISLQFRSLTQSCPTLYNPKDARPPCPSPTPGACSNSCPWCHPTISSSVVPFSSCPQSFPASGSFQMNQLFASGGQSTAVSGSASVLPRNIQDWFPLGLTGPISPHL